MVFSGVGLSVTVDFLGESFLISKLKLYEILLHLCKRANSFSKKLKNSHEKFLIELFLIRILFGKNNITLGGSTRQLSVTRE